MSSKPVHTYEGGDRRVTWDKRLCIHAEECLRSEGAVFEKGRTPWVDPNQDDASVVDEIVARCPSGALFSYPSETEEEAENTVTIIPNGPFVVRGNLNIEGAPNDMPGVQRRAVLCRCGHSQNKPFCDNSHLKSRFRDTGAVGKLGPGSEEKGGELTIECRPNGSLRCRGNLTIKSSFGQSRWKGTVVSLCRCGLSANKPFCDSTHKNSDFTTEDP